MAEARGALRQFLCCGKYLLLTSGDMKKAPFAARSYNAIKNGGAQRQKWRAEYRAGGLLRAGVEDKGIFFRPA